MLDAETLEPLDGFVWELERHESCTAVQGSYCLVVDEATAAVEVVAKCPGYIAQLAYITRGHTSIRRDWLMHRGEAVRVRVVDDARRPVVHALVATPDGSRRSTTDDNGIADVDGLRPAVSATLVVGADGHATQVVTLAPKDIGGGFTEIAIHPLCEITAAIVGPLGERADGARVELRRDGATIAEARTDASGAVTLRATSGTAKLCVWCAEAAPYAEEISVWGNVHLGTVALAPGVEWCGSVESSSKLVPGARVRLMWEDGTVSEVVITDADGRWTCAGLDRPPVRAWAYATGHIPTTVAWAECEGGVIGLRPCVDVSIRVESARGLELRRVSMRFYEANGHSATWNGEANQGREVTCDTSGWFLAQQVDLMEPERGYVVVSAPHHGHTVARLANWLSARGDGALALGEEATLELSNAPLGSCRIGVQLDGVFLSAGVVERLQGGIVRAKQLAPGLVQVVILGSRQIVTQLRLGAGENVRVF